MASRTRACAPISPQMHSHSKVAVRPYTHVSTAMHSSPEGVNWGIVRPIRDRVRVDSAYRIIEARHLEIHWIVRKGRAPTDCGPIARVRPASTGVQSTHIIRTARTRLCATVADDLCKPIKPNTGHSDAASVLNANVDMDYIYLRIAHRHIQVETIPHVRTAGIVRAHS